jgi:cytoskeletal protein CcmA (bactofilin family)
VSFHGQEIARFEQMLKWRKKNTPKNAKQNEDDRRSTPADRTVITSEWQVKGRVYGKGRVIIHCAFEGELEIQGPLIIESDAKVKGFFRAEDIRVGGRLEGRLESSQAVHMEETARVEGQVKTPKLQMNPGAQLNGDVVMQEQSASFKRREPGK